MAVTANQIKAIRAEIRKLKPNRLKLNSDRPLTNKEAIMTIAADLEAKRREGCTTAELVAALKKIDIHTNGATLNRYLHEARQARSDKNRPEKAPKTITQDKAVIGNQGNKVAFNPVARELTEDDFVKE